MLHELLIEKCKPHYWEGSEKDVVHLVEPLLIEGLTTESALETEPKLRGHKDDVFIEDVTNKERISSVSLSSMREEEVFEELELADSIVC